MTTNATTQPEIGEQPVQDTPKDETVKKSSRFWQPALELENIGSVAR